jgi:hypothetical protein
MLGAEPPPLTFTSSQIPDPMMFDCADAGEHTPNAIEARAIKNVSSLRIAILVELKRDTQQELAFKSPESNGHLSSRVQASTDNRQLLRLAHHPPQNKTEHLCSAPRLTDPWDHKIGTPKPGLPA